MKKKVISKRDQSKIDMAAEQWVRIVMEHIKWKKSGVTNKVTPKEEKTRYNTTI